MYQLTERGKSTDVKLTLFLSQIRKTVHIVELEHIFATNFQSKALKSSVTTNEECLGKRLDRRCTFFHIILVLKGNCVKANTVS